MSGQETEPYRSFTAAEWRAVRDQLASAAASDGTPALRLLASAMEDLVSCWEVLRPLQIWVDQHPDDKIERDDDPYGFLLTFAEADLLDAFQKAASKLMHLARDWPDFESITPDDVELSLFVRYVSVLLPATEALPVPDSFKHLVRQLAPLVAGQPWERKLSATLDALSAHARAEDSAGLAMDFVDVVLHDLPGDRHLLLIQHLELLYVGAGLEPPEWAAVFRRRTGEGEA